MCKSAMDIPLLMIIVVANPLLISNENFVANSLLIYPMTILQNMNFLNYFSHLLNLFLIICGYFKNYR
jgi:hypothetical protein